MSIEKQKNMCYNKIRKNTGGQTNENLNLQSFSDIFSFICIDRN